jgi:hypothetical protein
MVRRAQTRSVLHQSLKHFIQRDLGDERNPFCPLTAMDMVGGELPTARWFERPLLTVGATSGGAHASGMAPAAVVVVVLPPPRDGSAWDGSVRRVDCTGS